MIFGHDGTELGRHQLEHEQILPRAGWVEHDPIEIWERTSSVLISALNKTNLAPKDIAALGITNQRETTLVWDRHTGRPYYNAIVWQDTRSDRIAAALERDGRGEVIRRKAGLPPATYFSAGKLQWILDNVDGVRDAAEHGDAIFGTCDTWVLWNLTGGPRGGVHLTDVTNASRTMLMDLQTLDWDDELLSFFGIPRAMLPSIASSAPTQPFGVTHSSGRSAARCRSPAFWAISMRRWSDRSAWTPARPKTPTAPAISSCSTPAKRSSGRSTVC
ncbi:FGGY family of carbohydrate kinase, N-terminal domain protein [Mycobacterium xenopi 3993]|nr:FGGY family of carbohydrate kinase, N-terminal domain protein [Mycobacterium xenopi 3993]